ncbi:MAG: cupin domain-containing protein [Anaerolineae bacterium]|nr:cupin domain-containing protein [Anaerolineae bacterium]
MQQAVFSPAMHVRREVPTVEAEALTTRRIYNPIQKDAATFLQTSEETNGAMSLLEIEVAPGGGNALHYHTSFAEKFTVISGEFGVQVGKEAFALKPGESATAPKMSLHRWFNNTSEMAVVRVELTPGNAGFERSLRIAYGLATDGLVNDKGIPKNIAHLALLIELSDTGMPSIFSLIKPVMRRIAASARRRGIEQELIQRYCK